MLSAHETFFVINLFPSWTCILRYACHCFLPTPGPLLSSGICNGLAVSNRRVPTKPRIWELHPVPTWILLWGGCRGRPVALSSTLILSCRLDVDIFICNSRVCNYYFTTVTFSLGTMVPQPCPNGTYTHSNQSGLQEDKECLPCPPGRFCR